MDELSDLEQGIPFHWSISQNRGRKQKSFSNRFLKKLNKRAVSGAVSKPEDDEALRDEPHQEAIPTSWLEKAKKGTESLAPGEG